MDGNVNAVVSQSEPLTLLQKAQRVGVKYRVKPGDPSLVESIELLRAYIDGDVSGKGIIAATGIRPGSVSGWIGKVTVKGLRAGLIQFNLNGNAERRA